MCLSLIQPAARTPIGLKYPIVEYRRSDCRIIIDEVGLGVVPCPVHLRAVRSVSMTGRSSPSPGCPRRCLTGSLSRRRHDRPSPLELLAGVLGSLALAA